VPDHNRYQDGPSRFFLNPISGRIGLPPPPQEERAEKTPENGKVGSDRLGRELISFFDLSNAS